MLREFDWFLPGQPDLQTRVAFDDGGLFDVISPWTDEDAARVSSGEIRALSINVYRGFRESSLDFLAEVPSLRHLEILDDRQALDLAPLASLTSLLSLSLEYEQRSVLPLESLRALQHLYLPGNQRGFRPLDNLDCLTDLQFLRLPRGVPFESFAPLEPLKHLEHLELNFARKLTSFDGIENLPALTSLNLYSATKMHDWRGLAAAPGTFHLLSIESCRQVEEIAWVRDLQALEWLGVADCGKIMSLQPLAHLGRLRAFAFPGTVIEDADLSVLDRLPALEGVLFDDRRRYNLHPEDLPQWQVGRDAYPY